MVEFRDCRGELVQWDDDDTMPFDPPITPPDGDVEPESARANRNKPEADKRTDQHR